MIAGQHVGARHVLVHYHIFKNAGTSIDGSLRESFGPAWATFEGVAGDWISVTSSDMLAFLHEHVHVRALSSHSARWPEPEDDDVQPHPVVFLRHPIDRVGSVYAQRQRRREGGLGTSLSDFVDTMLSPDVWAGIRSFQTLHLSNEVDLLHGGGGSHPEATPAHFAIAVQRLRRLTVAGVVERYDESLRVLAQSLSPVFPELRLAPRRDNVSVGRARTVADRIQEIAAELGSARYRRLVQANEADLELHRIADSLLSTRVEAMR